MQGEPNIVISDILHRWGGEKKEPQNVNPHSHAQPDVCVPILMRLSHTSNYIKIHASNDKWNKQQQRKVSFRKIAGLILVEH